MSNDAVEAVLPTLRRERDPRLPQYVSALHTPRGWSLAQIASALGCSREWARMLELRGLREISRGERKDLSELPTFSRKRLRASSRAAVSLAPETARLLTALNEDSKHFHRGGDRTSVEAFDKMVVSLLEHGVPMRAIAQAVGQSPDGFRKRMAKHGIVVRKVKAALDARLSPTKPEPEAQQPQPLPDPKPRRRQCRWPDCPSRTGGACIHN